MSRNKHEYEAKQEYKQYSSYHKIITEKKTAAHDVCQLHCTCLIPQRAINRERAKSLKYMLLYVCSNNSNPKFAVELSREFSSAFVRFCGTQLAIFLLFLVYVQFI